MKVYKIETGNFKADGGAMFGVVPKVIWSKKYPANEQNLCNISDRSILIDTGERKVLVDTGIGNKQDEKWLSHHHLHGDDSLESSLKKAGFYWDEITDVILTHLHWDHCGGGVIQNDDGGFDMRFPNATYWVSKEQWDWAVDPNKREAPAYPQENIMPLKNHKQVRFVEEPGEIIPQIEVRFFNGHTRGLMLPIVRDENKTMFFAGDLIPVMANVPSVYVASYDVEPLITIIEKDGVLNEAVDEVWVIVFQHDLYNEACTVHKTQKGIREKDLVKIEEVFG